jgi:hypothetical protein
MFSAIHVRMLVGAWIAALAAIAAVAGVSITSGITVLWFAACVVPPGVMLLVWRGAPPPTMAEILHSVHTRD